MSTISHFRKRLPQKVTSLITTSFFMWVFYLSPNAYAVNTELTKRDKRQTAINAVLDSTPEKALARRLQLLKEELTLHIPQQKSVAKIVEQGELIGTIKSYLRQFNFFKQPALNDDQLESIKSLRDDIAAHKLLSDTGVALTGFEATDEHLKKHKLPAVAYQRHEAAKAKVKQKTEELDKKLNSLISAKGSAQQEEALAELTEFMSQQQFKRSHDKTNLDRLPFGPGSDTVRLPIESNVALQRYLKIPFTQLASRTSTGLLENTKTPTEADLAETIEIQFTDAIKAKAAELNHNPVEIYTWVHNNIKFIPSYGSIQGADYTLQNLKGNSFDTASLLIALLRVSNISARYGYGTIDVPNDKVMNWVGGVDNIQAATNLMSQGGIPVTLMRLNGQYTKVRMEHVWVHAFVDFEPSRGLKHKAGDNWIPMDASYKQHEFIDGMDIQGQVNLDFDALEQSIAANIITNEGEGWVQLLPRTDIKQQLETFQTKVEGYINTQNPDATLGEVLGLREVKIKKSQPLSAGLPYELITAKQVFTEIPSHLRHTFSYGLHAQDGGGGIGNKLVGFDKSLPELAGKKISLSYRPTTQDDEDIILSYMPEPDVNGEVDPAGLPASLPGHLINMTAQLMLGGELVAEAQAGAMGSEVVDQMKMNSPTGSQMPATNNNVVVGQYHAIGLDLQGISQQQLLEMQVELQNTKAVVEAAHTDPSLIDGLTGHQFVGDMLEVTIQSYWKYNNFQDEVLGKAFQAHIFRMPSYGKFSTSLNPSYSWGAPRDVAFSGMVMDLDVGTFAIATEDNDAFRQKMLVQKMGSRLSAMEHFVPEQIFSIETGSAEGISAVKAIGFAASEGQKVYTITSNNLNSALALINLQADLEHEIRDAVNSGKIVTTHEDEINFHGVITAGYIISDPDTGAAAYKISSGEDGSFIVALLITLLAVVFALGLIFSGGALGLVWGFGLLLWELANFFDWIAAINKADSEEDLHDANTSQIMIGLLGLMLNPGMGFMNFITVVYGIFISNFIFTWF